MFCFYSYISAGNLQKAASVLGKSKEEESLSLAAELAKLVGEKTFANRMETKKQELIKLKLELEKNNEKPVEITALPTRAELILNCLSDSESCKDSEKDTKSDIVPNLDIEESGVGPSDLNKQDDERNKNKYAEADHDLDSSKTTKSVQNDKLSGQTGDENATDVEKDTNIETSEQLRQIPTNVNATKEDNKVEVSVKNVNEDKVLNGKESSDKDKTDELLEELPFKMKDLMTENTCQNGNVHNGKANENKASAIVKDTSDLNYNINERGDHLTADADK